VVANPDHDIIAGFRHVIVSQDKSVRTYYDSRAKTFNLAASTLVAIGTIGAIWNAQEMAQHRVAGEALFCIGTFLLVKTVTMAGVTFSTTGAKLVMAPVLRESGEESTWICGGVEDCARRPFDPESPAPAPGLRPAVPSPAPGLRRRLRGLVARKNLICYG